MRIISQNLILSLTKGQILRSVSVNGKRNRSLHRRPYLCCNKEFSSLGQLGSSQVGSVGSGCSSSGEQRKLVRIRGVRVTWVELAASGSLVRICGIRIICPNSRHQGHLGRISGIRILWFEVKIIGESKFCL